MLTLDSYLPHSVSLTKRAPIKAHFVEPQKPLRDEQRRVSLPPRITRPTLSLSPEDDLDEGPASLGQPSMSSFVRKAQSTDTAQVGIFSSGQKTQSEAPTPARGRSLVFKEPPQQERRSSARQSSTISNLAAEEIKSSSIRPSLYATRSEDEGPGLRFGSQILSREVVSEGEDANPQDETLLPLKSLLFKGAKGHPCDREESSATSDAFRSSEEAGGVEERLLVNNFSSRDSSESGSRSAGLQSSPVRLPHSQPQSSDLELTPSTLRKSKLTFATSPIAATDRRRSDRLPHIGQLSQYSREGSSGDNKPNISSEDEGGKPYSDKIDLNTMGATRKIVIQEPEKEKRPSLNPRVQSTTSNSRTSRTLISSSPAHARPLSQKERISLRSSSKSSSPPPQHLKGKASISSRSPAHAHLKTRNIMPYYGDAEDSEESSQEGDGSDQEENEEGSDGSDDDQQDEDNSSEEDEDEDQDEEDESSEEEIGEEVAARRAVLSEFDQLHETRLRRNDSPSRVQDDTDTASLIAPSVDSRDLNHPMSFLPSAFEDNLDSSSPHLSFEDLSTQTQMKSFVREQQAHHLSPPLSPGSGGAGSSGSASALGLGQRVALGLGKRRNMSWHLKIGSGSGGKRRGSDNHSNAEGMETEREVDNQAVAGSRSSTLMPPRPSSPNQNISSYEASTPQLGPKFSPTISSRPLNMVTPKTPLRSLSGSTPSMALASCDVSSVGRLATSPPRAASGDAWHTLRHYLQTPTAQEGSGSSTPMGTGGAFYHLNALNQQLDKEEAQGRSREGSDELQESNRANYHRRRSQGAPSASPSVPSQLRGGEGYFDGSQLIRSAPATPPISSFLASTHVPPSALDLIHALNFTSSGQSRAPVFLPSEPLPQVQAQHHAQKAQKAIKIVSPPLPKDRDGPAFDLAPKQNRRRPRTANSSTQRGNPSHNANVNASNSFHFNKQELMDRFNPRRRRRSGAEMEWGWGKGKLKET